MAINVDAKFEQLRSAVEVVRKLEGEQLAASIFAECLDDLHARMMSWCDRALMDWRASGDAEEPVFCNDLFTEFAKLNNEIVEYVRRILQRDGFTVID